MEFFKLNQKEIAYKSTPNIYIDGKRAPINDFIECNKKIYVSLNELKSISNKPFSCDKENFFFGGAPLGKNYINDVCCPVSLINCEVLENFKYNDTVYENAMIFSNSYPEKPHFAEIEYRLNGLYKKFSFELIKLLESSERETIFWIIGEDLITDEIHLEKIENGQKIELDITGRSYMRIYFLNSISYFKYGICNAYLE